MSNNQPVKEESVEHILQTFTQLIKYFTTETDCTPEMFVPNPCSDSEWDWTGVGSSVQKPEILVLQKRYKLFQILFSFGLLLKAANVKIKKNDKFTVEWKYPLVPKEYVKAERLFICRTHPLIFLLFEHSYMFRSINGHHHRAFNNNLKVRKVVCYRFIQFIL
jgi:hypothetical protein